MDDEERMAQFIDRQIEKAEAEQPIDEVREGLCGGEGGLCGKEGGEGGAVGRGKREGLRMWRKERGGERGCVEGREGYVEGTVWRGGLCSCQKISERILCLRGVCVTVPSSFNSQEASEPVYTELVRLSEEEKGTVWRRNAQSCIPSASLMWSPSQCLSAYLAPSPSQWGNPHPVGRTRRKVQLMTGSQKVPHISCLPTQYCFGGSHSSMSVCKILHFFLCPLAFSQE